MGIRDWPSGERPREKLLGRGPEALSDAELLAVVLRVGSAGRTAVDLARDALAGAGGLSALVELDLPALRRYRGFGPVKYAELQACLELGKRYLEAHAARRGAPLRSPADTHAFLRARLRGYPFEVFACLFLDNRHRVIRYEELFRGTIDGASVHPREVVRRALTHNAAAVIFAHNHPSGSTEPSAADRAVTLRLREALALIDVRVLDHLVVGHGQSTSLAERGLL